MILSDSQQRTALLRQLQPQTQGTLSHHPYFLDSSHQAAAFLGDNTTDIDLDDINIDLDLEVDGDVNSQSLSSSPISTQSLLSQYAGPLSTLDSIPTIAVPRAVQEASLFKFPARTGQSTLPETHASLFANSDMMQTDSWLPGDQLTPKSTGRFSHHRESSLSSLGSAGPASPYSHNTSNPQIAVTDSLGDGFHGLAGQDDLSNYQLAKFPASTQDAFYPNYPNYAPADTAMMSAAAYSSMATQPRQRNGGSLLAATDRSAGPSRSRPLSVASSINSDSPATPSGEPEDDRRRKNIFNNTVPNLDRTMTDVYNDELYSPNFSIGSASSMHIPVSPKNDVFAQRVQAANSQHLSAGHSPVSAASRGRSPFRTNSPLAPAPVHDFSAAMNSSGMHFGSAQQLREQRKAVHDAQVVQQQLTRNADVDNPPTISPKDAMLDFTDADGAAASMPLFPQQTPVTVAQHSQQFDPLSLDDAAFNNYVTSHMPTGLQVPQQYPFIAQPRQQSSVPSLSTGSLSHSRLSSSDIGSSGSSHANSPQRPAITTADGGTYTCTYHGCTQRFETPALLQKHKREGHRQAHGLGATRRPEGPAAVAPGMFNSQAGPHRCDRINPSTGKPCNTVFSRPYDLTRHEDTIHNARKQKVRCDLCTDEKTFSRADALTRHYRVCHPDVELHGKHRRRNHV